MKIVCKSDGNWLRYQRIASKILMNIIYDVAPSHYQNRMTAHNTRTAVKKNIEISRANTQLYTRSPYYTGGQFWNKLLKHTQELRTKEKFKRVISIII